MATSWPTLGTVKTCPPPTINYYIEITAPGSPAAVSKVGNDNLTGDCRSTLSTFKALAGMGGGECTTIALASNNPQINVNGTGTAPPLRDVIESAGPGCKPE
jgi:hypothetical protein